MQKEIAGTNDDNEEDDDHQHVFHFLDCSTTTQVAIGEFSIFLASSSLTKEVRSLSVAAVRSASLGLPTDQY